MKKVECLKCGAKHYAMYCGICLKCWHEACCYFAQSDGLMYHSSCGLPAYAGSVHDQQATCQCESVTKLFAVGYGTIPPHVEPAEDIKAVLLKKAGLIVNGARRKAYGEPEQNFERIARFWQAYFLNLDVTMIAKDGTPFVLGAEHVSPLMRLMKEARICETPDHFDSHCDLIGYTMTGAEVNGVEPE